MVNSSTNEVQPSTNKSHTHNINVIPTLATALNCEKSDRQTGDKQIDRQETNRYTDRRQTDIQTGDKQIDRQETNR